MDDNDNDLDTQRLADYSDAVLRGQPEQAQGLDPADAALIRQLHALGTAAIPSPTYFARARRLAEATAARGQGGWQTPVRGSEQAELAARAALASGEVADPRSVPATQPAQPSPREITPPFWARVRTAKLSIAASLALLTATAAAILFVATNRDNGEPTVPAFTVATAKPTGSATVVPALVASPAASPSPNATGAFLLFHVISEPSAVGKETPATDLFASTEVSVPWDGAGMIIVSACPDRPCDLGLDDRLYVQVTNPERTEKGLWIEDNGANRTLPLVLTDRFRPGTNIVRAQLWDLRGDRRGTGTPIYIVILH